MGTILWLFQRFLSFWTFYFTLASKILILDVGLYPLHAHDIKCNINPLMSNQIMFCLTDTKKTFILRSLYLLIYTK